MKARMWAVLLTVCAVVVFACAGGSGSGSSDKGERACLARGGHWQKTGQHSARCLPPEGGWQ